MEGPSPKRKKVSPKTKKVSPKVKTRSVKENRSPIGKFKKQSSPLAKKRLSLSLRSNSKRFVHVSSQEMNLISSGYVPPNTEKNTRWALKVFNEWRFSREETEDRCPHDLLEKQCVESIDLWISRFVAEVRRSDGAPYPPKTIHQILSGLLRYMRSINSCCPNILDRKSGQFPKITGSCEVVFRQLRQSGIGANVKHTSIITMDEEQQLWDLGIINITEPLGLLRSVFYYVGKLCCLRGGEEQRSLKISQFVRSHEPEMYTYTERGSKNRSGCLAQLNLENKVVPIHATPQHHPRCLVFLLDLYFSKLPSYAFNEDIFYLRPKSKTPVDPKEKWYDCIPMGKNKLANVVKEMFAEAGLGAKTNHSLRATGATRMFNAGVPEKIIQKNTGHHFAVMNKSQ